MKQYLINAVEHINPTSPVILENNKFYHRNRVVDMATSRYLEANPHLVYEHGREDIVSCKDRAQHYGVRIGTSLGKKYMFHKSNHLSINANIKREMKKLFTFDMIA